MAIKALRPGLAAGLGAERFGREIGIAARLTNPHILPLFDSGEASGSLFYVMPYLAGESLREKLDRERQLDVSEAVAIVRQVAAALDYAHRHDVIHRDIKPENILLHEGEALVMDFGIAIAVSAAAAERLTVSGAFVGTPEYMSPEQCTGDAHIDGRSDVYSLACVLYELLAGEPPYTGPGAQSVLAKKLADPVPAIRHVRPAVPPAVERALMKALARVPADRFATAGAFAAALAETGVSRPADHSVAVLPFVNLSADPENEYFADGITEDVIAQLTKVRALKVISRTSVMRFKNRQEGLREIGRLLGVDTVLEGSVRRAGDRVRVVAQLINADTDEHLWADTYDRRLSDIFAIQSDVAVRITESLRAELSADERARIHKEPTTSPEAYQLYLQARCCHDRMTEEGLHTAIAYYRQAIDRDPQYALAWAFLGLAFVMLGMGFGAGAIRPREAYAEARKAIGQALAIDDALGDAHSNLALIEFVADYRWAEAEREFQRALELNPGCARTCDAYGLMLAAQARYDEALAMRRRALELDPLDPICASDLATTLLRAGCYQEALLEAQRLAEREPGLALAHSTLGWAHLHTANPAAGIAELEKATELSAGNTMFLAQLGEAYALAGRTKDARRVLQRLEQLARERYVPSYHFAYVYTGLGEQEKALDCLERAYEEHAGGIYGFKGSFLFASLRTHPRFRALLVRMNLA
ncbi:MAG: tetratricopeptide repeat protein [Gemmatimonadetes bacterium]|nr:tetratricopeptide repeat protein [Gemmatimonadota bacterium]